MKHYVKVDASCLATPTNPQQVTNHVCGGLQYAPYVFGTLKVSQEHVAKLTFAITQNPVQPEAILNLDVRPMAQLD